MTTAFRIDLEMLEFVRADLSRAIPPEIDAFERVGFLFVRFDEEGALAPSSYMPIPDEDYLSPPPGYGVYFGQDVINRAIVQIIETQEFIYSIHAHTGYGEPIPSRPDLKSEASLISCFSRVSKGFHGAVILSEDSILVRAWNPTLKVIEKIDASNVFKNNGGKK